MGSNPIGGTRLNPLLNATAVDDATLAEFGPDSGPQWLERSLTASSLALRITGAGSMILDDAPHVREIDGVSR